LRPFDVRTWAEETAPRVRPRLTRPVHASSRTRAQPCTPARPRRSTLARAPHRAYKAAQGLGRTSPRALGPTQAKVHRTSPAKHAAPPPAKPPEPQPPRPAHSGHPEAAPVARLASLEAREASQVLGPGKASPETPNHPRRTSVTRRRA
jgi:hypothetical protein